MKGKNFTTFERTLKDANSVAGTFRSIGMQNVKVTAEISQTTRHPTGRYAITHFDPNFDNRRSSDAIRRRMKKH